jgi:hypothetical protein
LRVVSGELVITSSCPVGPGNNSLASRSVGNGIVMSCYTLCFKPIHFKVPLNLCKH